LAEQVFRGDLRAPAAARSFALATLPELVRDPAPTLCDDLALVVSELVTNAVRAGSPQVRVELQAAGAGAVAVRVTDEAEGWPQPREADIHDTGGRGLALVSAVARTWGVRMDHDTKTVWAELSA
jgi:two-component sensor histidine kinase